MAITPGSRGRETRTDLTGEERDPLNPMQEPLGSMDRPGETVRRTGYSGTSNSPGAATTGSRRSLTTTWAVIAAILIAAFLVALYMGSNRSNVATGTGGTQAPVANSNSGTGTGSDTTGSTTTLPSPQTAPGTGNAGGTNSGGGGSTGGTTTPPATP